MGRTTRPRTGGRKKGTPNKKTLEVLEQISALDYDPITTMVKISQQAMADENYALAGQMAKELAQYVYPKRKAVEHFTDEPAEWPKITINITDDPKPLPNSPAVKVL
ncbi:MAG TPA: hypothetical protein EYM93_03530 [Methylococcales bacterium]|nr:hypothetical protein [Methylococcales bacterium]